MAVYGNNNLLPFEPGEYLSYKRSSTGTVAAGYFSILVRDDGERIAQESYPIEHLHTIIQTVNPRYDTWISQALFNQPNRRAIHLHSVALLFVDLDTYHIPALVGMKPEKQAEKVVEYCKDISLPIPSIILYSGRGLQIKFILTSAVQPDNLPEWNRVQDFLTKQFSGFGGDPKAKDVSRVLRLDQTVNRKSGEICRVVYVHSGCESIPARYLFEDFLALVPEDKPVIREKTVSTVEREAQKRRWIRGNFDFKTLNWARLYDIRDLIQMRGGQVPDGARHWHLFYMLNFLLLADPVARRDIWKEVQSLVAEINRNGNWYMPSDISTLYRKAQGIVYGEGSMFQGKKYPVLYTPRNQTLIDTFEIEPGEMEHLRTIIDQDEKNRRLREKRRAAGMKEQRFRNWKPWEEMGISRQWYYELRRRGELPYEYR